MAIDYAKVRPMFGGRLTQDQVDGINAIVGAFDKHGDGDLDKLAYLLATAKHETAHTMQPVRETLATSDKQAIARLDRAFAAGKLGSVKTPYWRDGWFGRGFVQLTHKSGYVKAAKETGLPFDTSPSIALQEGPAALVLVRGCLEGWFTGEKLGTYIGGGKPPDFVNARRVVNGTDKAQAIADLAVQFRDALYGSPVQAPKPPAATPTPANDDTARQPNAMGIVGYIIAGTIAIGAAIIALFQNGATPS